MELWTVRLSRTLRDVEEAQMMAFLPKGRRERLLRMRDRERWREPLCAYALLRLALRERFGWTELPEMQLGEKGKPFFLHQEHLHFNLSHSEGAVLVGLSDQPIGVDIQQLRPLSPRTQHRLDDQEQTAEQYFRNWTRYEAWSKRNGTGVSPHFNAMDKVEAQELSCFPGYAAAVSGEGEPHLHFRTQEDLLQE